MKKERKSLSITLFAILISLIVLLLVVLNISFVFAQGNFQPVFGGISTFFREFAEFMNPVIKYVFGDVDASSNISYAGYGLDSGQILFAKILFFILILAIVYMSVKQMELFFQGNEFVMWTVAIIVSILSVRFLGASVIRAIIFPYEVSGIAISAFIPFLIWFVFIEWGLRGSRNRIIRKIAWCFYIVIFIGIYITRAGSGELGAGTWIYPATLTLSIIAFFMDGTIQRMFFKVSLEKQKRLANRPRILDLYRQLENAKSIPDVYTRERTVDEIIREIEYLERKT